MDTGKTIALIKAFGGSGGGSGSDLPAAPTTDGLYTLESDVSSGSSTLGWGEKGWKATESRTTLTNESVTTESTGEANSGIFSYSTPITANEVVVTFNGTPYVCQRIIAFGAYIYGGFSEGGPDFSEFPFTIVSGNMGNLIYTETAGTYSVKIEAVETSVTTTPHFDQAVAHTGAGPLVIHEDPNSGITDRTWQEVSDASMAGQVVIFPDTSSGRVFYAVRVIGDPYEVYLLGATTGNPAVSTVITLFADTADGYLYED